MKTVLGKAEQLPFLNESFDIVVSFTAIQNFDDIKKGLGEMKRVLKPFGSMDILTALKKSDKIGSIEDSIRSSFEVIELVEEEKDIIFVCRLKELSAYGI